MLTIEKRKNYSTKYCIDTCAYCNNDNENYYYEFVLDTVGEYGEFLICNIDLQQAIEHIIETYPKIKVEVK